MYTVKRFTIGKELRKQKGLRKKDPTGKVIQPEPVLAEYIAELEKQGVQHKGLAVGQFYTKNGLPYTGLIATELIPSNRILIRVPTKCLLNTEVAFHSNLQPFFEQHPEYFSKYLHDNWYDHILLAFILYEYGRGKDSSWYYLIKNLPREIDYVIFWPDKDIEKLQDQVLVKMIQKYRSKYNLYCKQFLYIAQKHPEFFKKYILLEENYQWIHIHLVTRCFGKYFEYTTMVPFAELLNHDCSDVYYTMWYDYDNPYNPKEEFYEEKVLTEDEILELDTSDGTYNSSDFEDNEVVWREQDILAKQLEKEQEQSESNGVVTKQEVEQMIRDTRNYLTNFVNFGDAVSLGFLLENLEALDILSNSPVSLPLKKVEASRIQGNASIYVNTVKWFHSKIKSQHYANNFAQRNQKRKESTGYLKMVEPDHAYFPAKWENYKFDEFLMLCSTKDQFEKGAQVFFCYGRLSNRMLLMRYGITVYHNKYDHIFLRLDRKDYCQKYVAFPQKLKYLGLSRLTHIKVKRTKFCIELITFLRGLKWRLHDNVDRYFHGVDKKKELDVLYEAYKIYYAYLNKFEFSLYQNEALLRDKSLGYHDYFTVIYKLEKQRILRQQLLLVRISQRILQRVVEKGLTVEMAGLRIPELETAEYFRRNRLMLSAYLDVFLK